MLILCAGTALAAGCSSSSTSASSEDDSADAPSVSAAAPVTSASAPAATTAASSAAASPTAQIRLFPAGARFDYQLGGPYTPPAGVQVVSRDSTASPASGIYNVCYINAFQAQPDALDWWKSNHPDLLLPASDGSIVMDPNWNEALLDDSTAAKRAELAAIEDGWIDGCAGKGFQAIEADNLDSYSRSNNLLTSDENVAFATLLATHAHAKGLAIAQKNTVELVGKRQQIGFDFAVSEQCGTYGECGQYAAAYADRVLDIEYDDSGLAAACRSWAGKISIVERDMDVTTPDNSDYVYKTC
ncbi:MAG TPA: endo alpha-1,4 polygalactosaminidase [Actinospica sp.]|nr:endo alpha-1,4 polygalactosaminidase [Actinospica sp.]